MKYGIKLVEMIAEESLYIRIKASIEELPSVVGLGYGKICEYLAEMGEEPCGLPYIAYHNLDANCLDMEIGFPVTKQIPAKSEIKSGYTVYGLCLETMYKGPYSALLMTFDYLNDWMAENGYEPVGPRYEYFYNSSRKVPADELLTRIIIPVRKKEDLPKVPEASEITSKIKKIEAKKCAQ